MVKRAATGMGRRRVVCDDDEEGLIRMERRRKMGRLGDLVIPEKTKKRYLERVRAFLKKRRKYGEGWIRTVAGVGEALVQEIEDMWWDGDPKGWAADLICGAQHFSPRCKKGLHGAWRLYAAWNRLGRPDRASPMDVRLMRAVAWGFWRRGWRRTAVLVVAWYHCYLRTGEAVALTRGAVTIGRGGKGVVSLGVTKGGRMEMVTLDDGRLGKVAEKVWRGLAPGDRIMGMEPAGFRKLYREILEGELPLERMRYKPYSFRRGGATRDFREHGPLDRAQVRGRWKSVSAAMVYILEGVEMFVRLGRKAEEELLVLRRVQKMMAVLKQREEEWSRRGGCQAPPLGLEKRDQIRRCGCKLDPRPGFPSGALEGGAAAWGRREGEGELTWRR